MLPLFAISGAMVVGGVLTALSALGFWTKHEGSAIGLGFQMTVFSRYPLSFYPKVLAWVLVTVLPFSFIGFIPATLYMQRPDWHVLALLQPLVGVLCLALGYSFWRISMRRYTSTGT